jgi:hypothetical protein
MADSDTYVIVASPWKTAVMCLGSIAFVALGGWLVEEHPSEKAVIAGWATLVFFALTGVMWTIQLVWPSRLVLDRNGLAYHYLFATFRRRWVDVDRIDVEQVRSTRIVKLTAKPGGRDLALGGAWPMSADDLVLLIEGYLARFGQTNAA